MTVGLKQETNSCLSPSVHHPPPPCNRLCHFIISDVLLCTCHDYFSRLLCCFKTCFFFFFFLRGSLVQTTDIFFFLGDVGCIWFYLGSLYFHANWRIYCFCGQQKHDGWFKLTFTMTTTVFWIRGIFRECGEKSPNSSKCLKVRNGDTQEAPSGVGCL